MYRHFSGGLLGGNSCVRVCVVYVKAVCDSVSFVFQFLQLSLFFDILLCLTTEINHDDYVAGHFISRAVREHSTDPTVAFIMQRARAKLWMHLREIKMKSSVSSDLPIHSV